MEYTRFVVFCVVGFQITQAIDNFKTCGDCSNRDDVSCKIQNIPYPCPHGEFRDNWPGPPRDLTVEQVHSLDKTWPWLANFTWKPPYDASISSLTGFFITVNSVVTNLPVIRHPKCFFANLSGTDWAKVKDPYSVMFHFDCIRVQMRTTVHMRLTSSPVPLENPGATEAKIHLGKRERRQYRIVLPTWDKRRTGISEPNPKKLKIKYDVSMSDVKVMFDPLAPATSYFVCLSQHKNYYRSCDKSVNTTKSPVVFTDVKRDNYTIMIKPSTENSIFYATTYFFVPGRPEAHKTYIDFTILSIIMACLIFVTMATTTAFCIMRKQERCVPACIKRCKEKSLYQQTPTNIPNNAPDENEAIDVFMVSLEDESVEFVDAVGSVIEFLKKWGSCNIEEDLASLLQNHGTCQINGDAIGNKKFIFFISDNMIDLIKYKTDDDLETDAEISVNTKLISRLLREELLRDSQKTFVSFHSNKSSELEDIKILNLTKLVEGKSRPDIGLHVDNVHQLLKKVGSTNLDMSQNWSESEESINVLTKMKVYLSNYKQKESGSYRSNSQLSDHGYESRVYTEESQSFGDIQHPIHTAPTHLVHADTITSPNGMNEVNVRLQETQRWAESQSQIRPSFGCQYYQSQNHNQIEYHKVPNFNISATYVDNIDCYPRAKGHMLENTGIRLTESRNELSPSEECYTGAQQHIEWVPPTDDDTESITFSVICEKQQELNDSYKHSLTSTKRV